MAEYTYLLSDAELARYRAMAAHAGKVREPSREMWSPKFRSGRADCGANGGLEHKPKAAVTLRTASITGTSTSPTNAAVPAIVPSARRSAPLSP